MGSEEEGRLRSFLLQLRSESGILERMIYKNKNQHRRCPYFQSLLKVRRDVRLMLFVGLEDILKSAFQVIHGKNPAQRAYLLERLKEGHFSVKHNFQERLRGVARLLSQMIEPILRAAIQISTLLARSFFMAFSLTILSLLARLRVLVQQMLIDTVSVFNKVSSLSERRHTVKLIKNGVETFREYFPPNGEAISLDCSWQGDKFVLLERAYVSGAKEPEDVGVDSVEAPEIQYETLEASDEDQLEASDKGNEVYSKKLQRDIAIEEVAFPLARRHASDTATETGVSDVSDFKDEENIIRRGSSAQPSYSVGSHMVGASSSNSQGPCAPGRTLKAAAFVPVKVTPEIAQSRSKKMKLDDPLGSNPFGTNEVQDSFLNLLTAGSLKNSLFD